MYVTQNLSGLGGSEFLFGNADGTWQQSDVDRMWTLTGRTDPVPQVPASMIGWYPVQSKLTYTLSRTKGKFKGSRALNPEEKAFKDYIYSIGVSPYVKKSGVGAAMSKIAGGVLKVASVVFPVMGTINAVADAGNLALALQGAKGDATRANESMNAVLTIEKNANTFNEARKDLALAEQLKALQLPAADSFAPVSVSPSTAQIKFPTAAPKLATQKFLGLTSNQLIGVALLGAVLLARK